MKGVRVSADTRVAILFGDQTFRVVAAGISPTAFIGDIQGYTQLGTV